MPDGALIELVKGVFGLQESPRLWWLKLRDAVLEAGFEEIPGVPGVFALFDKLRKLVGLLCVHVDDGTWGGIVPCIKKALDILRRLLTIKVERTGTFDILGRRVTHKPDMITVSQHEYVAAVKPIPVSAERKRNATASLTDSERTQYLSLTQQLSWPARTTMPGLCFAVSSLQQRTPLATVADLSKANWELRNAQTMSRSGAELRFKRDPAFDLKDLMVIGAHDASFGQQTGQGSQQGSVVMIAGNSKALTEKIEAQVCVLDWSSSKIHRIVRSTLAAEAASASTTHDRATLIRHTLAWLVTPH